MLSSRNRDGSTPSRLAEVPRRGVGATQSTNVGSRVFAICDPLARFSWTAMITRVGTATGTVARLSEMRRANCELIRVFNTQWQGAWSGSYKQTCLTTCMAEWRVIDLGTGRTSFRESAVTARARVVPTRVAGRCGICSGKRPRERWS